MTLATSELFTTIYGDQVVSAVSITLDGAVRTYSPRMGTVLYAIPTFVDIGTATTESVRNLSCTWSGGAVTFSATGVSMPAGSIGDQINILIFGTA